MEAHQSHELSDHDIILFIVEHKDSKPFHILYDRYADKVYAKCLSFTNSQPEAENLAHDIFLKVYLKLKTFKVDSKFSTWLYSITYNYCVDFVTKARKTKEVYQEYAEEMLVRDDEYEEEMLQIRVDQLKVLLEKINPEDKALLLMKYQDDLSIKEIALITELSESAVKMRLKRTKEKIVEMSRL